MASSNQQTPIKSAVIKHRGRAETAVAACLHVRLRATGLSDLYVGRAAPNSLILGLGAEQTAEVTCIISRKN
jgi:hypothetical protein